MCPPRPPLRSKRISVCSVRAVYHGRAPHAPPLPSGASAMLRLGGYGGGRLKAGGRLSKPLPVLPYHRALHASVAGGRARRGAADLHPVSAARGRWGPRDVRFTVIGGRGVSSQGGRWFWFGEARNPGVRCRAAGRSGPLSVLAGTPGADLSAARAALGAAFVQTQSPAGSGSGRESPGKAPCVSCAFPDWPPLWCFLNFHSTRSPSSPPPLPLLPLSALPLSLFLCLLLPPESQALRVSRSSSDLFPTQSTCPPSPAFWSEAHPTPPCAKETSPSDSVPCH